MSKAPATLSMTIRDVAARAGVSIKTVSRVLNDEPGVVPATRALVRAVVAELGYSPNPSARNLASFTSNVIGFAYRYVGMDEEDMRGGHQYSRLLEVGALEACQQREFGMIPLACDIQRGDLAQRLVAEVRKRRLGGLVIALPLSKDVSGILGTLNRAGIPYVCVNPDDLRHDAPHVAIDETAAAYGMTAHLIERGHRRIGFIQGMRGLRITNERLAGYRQAMADHGLPVDERWVTQGEFTFASGVRCGAALIGTAPRVTAIFASNDDMAVGVMHAAYARGLRIPDDLSVAGFDDTQLARFSWPPLTTVRQPLEDMAQAAVAQLAALIRPQRAAAGAVAVAAHQTFTCRLIVRASVGAPVA